MLFCKLCRLQIPNFLYENIKGCKFSHISELIDWKNGMYYLQLENILNIILYPMKDFDIGILNNLVHIGNSESSNILSITINECLKYFTNLSLNNRLNRIKLNQIENGIRNDEYNKFLIELKQARKELETKYNY